MRFVHRSFADITYASMQEWQKVARWGAFGPTQSVENLSQTLVRNAHCTERAGGKFGSLGLRLGGQKEADGTLLGFLPFIDFQPLSFIRRGPGHV